MLRTRFVYVQVTFGQATALLVSTGERATVLSQAFSHPRSLMGDYAEVKKCFRQLLETLHLTVWYRRKPWALVHVIPKQEGGYTNVELRAFRESMMEAGCERVYLLGDREPPLTSTQLAEVKEVLGKSFLSD